MIAPFLALALALQAPAAKPETVPAAPTAAEVLQGIGRGVDFLLGAQNDDGSWGGAGNQTFTSAFANPATYHTWQVGTTALATLSVLELGRDEKALAAADRGLDWLCTRANLVRPAEWDVDNVWGLIYGLNTLARALLHPRYAEEAQAERAAQVRKSAAGMVAGLARYQSPRGGWGYYADPGAQWRPEWATSFTSAAGLIALVEARAAGLEVDPKVFDAAVRAVERARLPNGAYSYEVRALPGYLGLESIDQVKGSLGRIQVCNYALHRAGAKLPDGALERGLEQFLAEHRFLEVARNKPIPHEAYYANAAYFYLFGHYYAAKVLDLLPPAAQERFRGPLQRELLKCQQKDGSMWDFWLANNTKPYGTSFGVLGLSHTVPAAE